MGHWSGRSLVRSVTGPVGHWSGRSLVRSVTGPVGHWSGRSLVRSVTGPSVTGRSVTGPVGHWSGRSLVRSGSPRAPKRIVTGCFTGAKKSNLLSYPDDEDLIVE